MNKLSDPQPTEMQVVDSHTGGEPTRIVISGWPQPPGKTMAERRRYLIQNQDHLRQAVVCEPKGHNAIIGGLVTPPVHAESEAGIIFFNDVGYLDMCGHGLIGLAETFRFLGRITKKHLVFDTPVGRTSAEIGEDGKITITNVPSYVYREGIEVDVPNLGRIRGDIAYGGNWFFLVETPVGELRFTNLDFLMASSKAIRQALHEAGITGADQKMVDHIEFYGPPTVLGADSKNFVLCPGNAYDRSCCGTGTSAKMAGLHAKGKLKLGKLWTQESITGSIFEGWLEKQGGRIIPHIRSSAFVVSQSTLYFDPDDEFCWGIG